MNETRQQAAQLRAVDRENRTISIVASDFSIDSYGTRIDPAGWDLEQFRRNPVILLSHHDRTFPAGKAINETIRIEDSKLLMTVQFPARGKQPDADIAFELYADGFMRGISVGFQPLDWEDREEGEGDEKRHVRVYTRSKLLEVSLVTIPSNDNALAQRAANLNWDAEEVAKRTRELETLLEETRIDPGEFEKLKSYFERKQPVNKLASKVMVRFFQKVLGEDQPADELEAWQRMLEAVEATTKVDEPEKTEGIEETEEESGTVEVPVTQETPPAEAPQPERKASVLIPLSVLNALPGVFMEQSWRAAVEASRHGLPASRLGEVAGHMGTSISQSLLSQ